MNLHHRFLETLYLKAPVNVHYPSQISIDQERCTIRMDVNPAFFHGGNSLHGSVYFKLLDDAAYFACSSIDADFFLLTASFNISFFRPVTSGLLIAEGKYLEMQDSMYKGSASLRDESGKLAAKGHGLFARSKTNIKEL
jgi:uncharacterized protein (TIGR00369 family)